MNFSFHFLSDCTAPLHLDLIQQAVLLHQAVGPHAPVQGGAKEPVVGGLADEGNPEVLEETLVSCYKRPKTIGRPLWGRSCPR
jgi:hypothetical protein